MVIGYVVSAGIVVLVLVCYYIFTFDPTIDAFQHPATTSRMAKSTTFRPNRVDELVIGVLRGTKVMKMLYTISDYFDLGKSRPRVQEASRRVFLNSLPKHHMLIVLVHISNERFADHDRCIHPDQWIRSTKLWHLVLPLANHRLSRVVFKPDTFRVSDLPSKLSVPPPRSVHTAYYAKATLLTTP